MADVPGRDGEPNAAEIAVMGMTLAAAGIGWVEWHPTSGSVRCSVVGARLMGVDGQTSTDMRVWLGAIASGDRLRLHEALLGDGATGAHEFTVEYRLPGHPGSPSHVEVRGRVDMNGDGIARGTAVLTDVSAMRARERVLLAREEHFRDAFEKAPVPMALTTLEDMLLDVNQAFIDLSGYARVDVVGHNAAKQGFWSSVEDQRKLDAFLTSDDTSRTLDLHLRTRRGRIRDVLILIARMPARDDGLVKVLLDVTERRGMQRKLVQALRETMRDSDWLAQRLLKELAALEGDSRATPLIADFTPRERQVLELLARGLSNDAVAAALGITSSTVRNYVSALYSKLGVDSRAEAVVWGREHGLGGE